MIHGYRFKLNKNKDLLLNYIKIILDIFKEMFGNHVCVVLKYKYGLDSVPKLVLSPIMLRNIIFDSNSSDFNRVNIYEKI